MSGNEDLTVALRSDFKSVRALATCSICDQLLYEPWTIACGHTYCYSCLCSWFSQDKHKKSCPECRSKVKLMPAPSFLVKQLVEVILKRSELMLADESVEQHKKKMAEEVSLVENDRNSSKGLFKGMFAVRQHKLMMDEADGVWRCSGCGFEHEGGVVCSNCGEHVVEEDDYDIEAAEREVELDSMVFDLGAESDEDDLFNFHDHHHLQNYISNYIDMNYSRRMRASLSQFRLNRDRSELVIESDSEGTGLSITSDSSESEIDGEDDSSLQGFIAPDEDEENIDDCYDEDGYESTTNVDFEYQHTYQSSGASQRHTLSISDDGSDEGGAISNRRQRRKHNHTYSNSEIPSFAPSAMTMTDASSNESEESDQASEVGTLGHPDWSSLERENGCYQQSDTFQPKYCKAFPLCPDDEININTETMVDGNMSDNDENDDNSLMERSSHRRISFYDTPSPQFYEFSELSYSQSTDVNKDTDVSASYHISRNSHHEGYPTSTCESRTCDERNFSIDSEIEEGFRLTLRQNSPLSFGNIDMSQTALAGTNGMCRKRAARESLAQDSTETDTSDININSRRRKPWVTSRKCHNFRENSFASRFRGEEAMYSQISNGHGVIHTEKINLATIVNEQDEESDDSIQPPSRRHLRNRI